MQTQKIKAGKPALIIVRPELIFLFDNSLALVVAA